jgi:cell division protein FtsW (lipid II flippase)
MDLLNYLISVVILGVSVQFGELWISLGTAMILIIASKDIKTSILLIITMGVLYFITGIGMQDYWLFAIIGLIALGYLMGLGEEKAASDPYAGLLGGGGMDAFGGMGGGMGM